MRKTLSLVLLLTAVSYLAGCRKDTGLEATLEFVAMYNVTETWTENSKPMTKPQFTISVIKSSVFDNMLLINNFGNYGSGITAEAIISGKNLTISKQVLPNLKEIEGTAILTDTSLNITYTEKYNTTSFDINAVAKKK
jgi:hypothetical protein